MSENFMDWKNPEPIAKGLIAIGLVIFVFGVVGIIVTNW
jgi:vacuolar-type H+-ATPase subunit I/STV1